MKLSRIAIFGAAVALFATEPNDATKRWWAHIVALANDGMEGRDTGSEGYRKAERYVIAQFEQAGLKPAGEKGYAQDVALHEVRFQAGESSVELVRPDGATRLQWLRQINVPARLGLPETLEADLVFPGDGPAAGAAAIDTTGKIVVQLPAVRRPAAPGTAQAGRGAGRGDGRARTGIAGTIAIDTTVGPEPPHWPVPYSVATTLAESPQRQAGNAPPTFRFNPASAGELFRGSGHTYEELQKLAAEGKPLPQFALPAKLRATMKFTSSDLSSDNIAAVLPGSDPTLADEYVVVSAHLDGYGIGEPRDGDKIYNGAFDDVAYVATLIDFAQKLHESGKKFRRSLLFLVVTGEEKGLLGSKYFALHPTIPKEKLVADINLDQLRPIFPLKTLTTIGLEESTLGETARRVGEAMNIRIQADAEPERRLIQRADNYSFMQIGVPAVGFVFGYDPGSPEEAVYRRWYAERYHSPSDDINQPWDPPAAAKFNDFFARVVEAVSDAPQKPKWRPGSPFAHADVR
jgi:Zn-dependent M28 family amino/carboxypeptidase